jgi:two-component system, sensor histidine kinase and response regulator
MDQHVKFLLVDDMDENLVALEALLRRDGLELYKARSGTDALELLLVHDFALALVDVQMPGMDGFELAELMRGSERSKHVPIIFVTAGTHEPMRVFKGYESGAVDFLFKPIDPQVLRHKCNVFFELHYQRLQLVQELRERERLNEELREMLRLNEMFYAALGHDLRNPLSAVMTGAALIRQSGDARTVAVGNRIMSSASRMARMIEQLLDLARARLGGGIPITRAETDLRTVAARVVAEHQTIAPERTIEIHADGDLRGAWDETRLAQVLSNLLANAVQHGTAHRPIRIDLEGRAPDAVIVSVSNDGAIPATLLPHLFEPFRSSRSDHRRSEGLGLGLYIVDQVVKAHHGRVQVQSTPEQGTTFRIRLPRVLTPLPERTPSGSVEPV